MDQFENMIFQGSSEEGLTIYNMTESNLERDKSDCNYLQLRPRYHACFGQGSCS